MASPKPAKFICGRGGGRIRPPADLPCWGGGSYSSRVLIDHPRMGILIFEVNPDGKIQNIKVRTGDRRDDAADLDDSGLTGVASLTQLRAGALQMCSVRVDSRPLQRHK